MTIPRQGTLWRNVPAPPERELKKAILLWAFHHPRLIVLTRTPAGSIWIPASNNARGGRMVILADEGWSDLTGYVPAEAPKMNGRVVAVEVKRSERETPTPAQIEHLTRVVHAGGIAILAWAVDQFAAEYRDAVGA